MVCVLHRSILAQQRATLRKRERERETYSEERVEGGRERGSRGVGINVVQREKKEEEENGLTIL